MSSSKAYNIMAHGADIPNECCVCLLISEGENGMKDVLLVKKDKTVYKARYNGVGGKRKVGERWIECALREIAEETGAKMNGRLVWLGKTVQPVDIKSCPRDEGSGGFTPFTLQFYTGLVDKSEVAQQAGETERLEWFPLTDLLSRPVTDDTFAGDGDLLYFARKAAICYGWSKV